jgi:hypothetical protein
MLPDPIRTRRSNFVPDPTRPAGIPVVPVPVTLYRPLIQDLQVLSIVEYIRHVLNLQGMVWFGLHVNAK